MPMRLEVRDRRFRSQRDLANKRGPQRNRTGHERRFRLRIPDLQKMNPTENIAVVGSGFLGMTLALRLAQAGHRVTLFESAGEIGGLASAWEIGGYTWDKHYHVTLASDSHTRGLVEEL